MIDQAGAITDHSWSWLGIVALSCAGFAVVIALIGNRRVRLLVQVALALIVLSPLVMTRMRRAIGPRRAPEAVG